MSGLVNLVLSAQIPLNICGFFKKYFAAYVHDRAMLNSIFQKLPENKFHMMMYNVCTIKGWNLQRQFHNLSDKSD